MRGLAGVFAAAVVGLTATAASAAVTVLGGGLAQQCGEAAKAGVDTPQAEQACTSALEGELLSTLDRAGTYVNRGVIKMRRKLYDGAIRDFDTAIMSQPDLAEAYVNRGAANIGLHRFKEGLDDVNKALELGVPEPEKAYYNRALAHEWLDDPKAAWLDYKKAVELAPDWDLPKAQLERFTISQPEIAGAPEKP
jgi:tetratricopeptide (TPR) repeat protein